MSKRKLIVVLAVFNALMCVAFVFSSIYIWDFVNSLTSERSHDNSGTTTPIIK